MIKRLELDKSAHKELISYCKIKNIQFLHPTHFDLNNLDVLSELNIQIYSKIPSGEITSAISSIYWRVRKTYNNVYRYGKSRRS